MKVSLKIISITCITMLIGLAFSFFLKAESTLDIKQTIIVKENVDNNNIQTIIDYNDNNVIVKKDSVKLNNEVIYGDLIDYVIDKKIIYLLIHFDENNYLYKMDNSKILKVVELKMDSPKSICLYDDNIIVGGASNNNMSLDMYNVKLELVETITYKGEGYQTCMKLMVLDSYIYVVGIKNGIANNKYFKNVGNKNELKTFIFKFDRKLNLIKDAYFNELADKEIVEDLYIYGSQIGLLIRGDKTYNYVLDINLNLISRVIVKEYSKVIQTKKLTPNSQLYIYQSPNYINIEMYCNDKTDVIYRQEGTYINHYVDKGVLKLYYLCNDVVYLKEISEYHINKLETKYLDYFDYDETNLSHISIDSYLEDLTISIDNISPYFMRNQNGKYEITYLVNRENEEEITVKTPLVVKDYVNIKEGLIYPTGYQLFFFGTAKLNNKSVNNGTILSEEGKQVLEITDANGNVKTYTFKVVSGYYKTLYVPTMSGKYEMEQSDSLLLCVGRKKVKSVVINENEVGKIHKINEDYFVEVSAETTPDLIKVGYQKINITKLIYDDNTTQDVKHSFVINVKKCAPICNIQEAMNDQKLNLNIDITDYDQNISDVVVEVYQNKQLVKSISTALISNKIILPKLQLNTTFEVYVKILTESASTTIMYYQGSLSKNEDIELSLTFGFDNTSLKKVELELDLSSPKLVHKQLQLGQDQRNISQKYQVKRSNLVIYISIIVSAILLVLLIIYIARKKVKRKREY